MPSVACRFKHAITESSNDSLATTSSLETTRESASATGSGSGSRSIIGNATETLPCTNREASFLKFLSEKLFFYLFYLLRNVINIYYYF